MRIAANEIERALEQAAIDQENANRVANTARLDELASAFRRANEMRRTPFGRAIVRGAKDKIEREVLTTQFTEEHGGRSYRWCLQRYTDEQDRRRRRTEDEYLYRRVGDTKGRWLRRRPSGVPLLDSKDIRMLDVRALFAAQYHVLLIREDRLERG